MHHRLRHRIFPRIGKSGRIFSNHWKTLALAACALAVACAWGAEDAAARKARQKAERGVKGRVWAIADDEFVVYVDGKKAVSGDLSKTPEPKEVTLKPGHVIAVRAVNREGECGFGLIFVSNSGKIVFSTNSGEWDAYKPASAARWWDVNPASVARTKPVLGSNPTINHDIEALAAQGCDEVIWGDLSEDVAYLYRVITVEELIE